MGIAINAHYDGKVIVPDEPLDLPPNQALVVRIESISGNTLARPDLVSSCLLFKAGPTPATVRAVEHKKTTVPANRSLRSRRRLAWRLFAAGGGRNGVGCL
jgi:hypothetical protein